ncbi:MAG: SAM-dependent methyltransferase [Bdellovibrionota bacterium]
MNSMNLERQSPWWSDFFQGLSAEVVRRVCNSEQTQNEADFIFQHLQLPTGAVVGDVPCGDGRLAIALAKKGLRVRGLDISPELIRAAGETAFREGVSLQLEVGDMKEMKWEDLDGAYCFGNSFAYFDESGNRRFLSAIQRSLKPGGRFLLQTNVIAESILTRPFSRTWFELGDILFLHSVRYEPERASLISDYQFTRGAECEKKQAIYRVYGLRELLGLLEEAGFRDFKVMGSFEGAPFKLGDPSLYVSVRK